MLFRLVEEDPLVNEMGVCCIWQVPLVAHLIDQGVPLQQGAKARSCSRRSDQNAFSPSTSACASIQCSAQDLLPEAWS